MSRIPRRAVLALAAAALAGGAFAQTPEWAPNKPVRIIVPIVGSTNDVLARLVAPKLQEALGQPVVVENKPGAGGNIGADLVAKSPPDGHTLLVGYNGPLAINVSLFDKMPYDPLKDLQPITLAVKSPQYLVVNPASGITSLQDLLAKAKAEPNKYSYASVAVGSASHLTMEMLKSAANVNLTHIPYKGAAPALTDLVAGNVHAAFMVPGNVQQFAKDGRLKLIASSGTKRFPSTPDVPTVAELGFKDFEATSWIGFLTTAETPKPIVERYNRELVKILQMPDIQARLRDMEFEVVASTPEQFGNWIRSEIPRWGRVIKATGAKAE
ncbi:tripartite tricarboxylate transporter substrate binding protein [Ramlibacter sp. AN1015]|uniref:Bug family tripartite tricarboxylate transporter substrate binding protein n=1 Tax=Ramlibacter sp. AN1015 TaxID=3133428 RepID=UPI0030BD809D